MLRSLQPLTALHAQKSPHCRKMVRECSPGCWDLLISWMSGLRPFQATLCITEDRASWFFLPFEEQLNSIGSVCSFPEVLLVFVGKMHKKSCHFVSVVMYSLKCGRTHCWGQLWFIISTLKQLFITFLACIFSDTLSCQFSSKQLN